MEALHPDKLSRRCDLDGLGVESSDDLEPLGEVIGQPRAVSALEFGIGIAAPGYNLFVFGPDGVGKRYLVDTVLERCGADRPPPDDLCYVNNFEHSERPVALRLPAGRGAALRADMARLVDDLQTSLIAAFNSDEYQTRRQMLDDEFHGKQEQALEELQEAAKERGLGMLRSPSGIVFAPVRDGDVMPRKAFDALPEAERQAITEAIESLSEKLREITEQIPEWYREWQARLREHEQETTRSVIPRLIGAVRDAYADIGGVRAYLDAVEADVTTHAGALIAARLREQEQKQPTPEVWLQSMVDRVTTARYEINLVVDNGDVDHAPVIVESHPTLANLLGRIEHTAQMGALTTDFRLIRAGALHRANGGFLVIDARRLLSQPFAWEALKRTLEAGEIRLESVGENIGLAHTVSLEPDSVPLDVKVVLVGGRRLYYLLSILDPEFPGLFKVAADFADQLDRGGDGERLFARALATIARGESLRPLEGAALGRVVEHAARIAGDATKLSTHFGEIADLLREADHLAGGERITAADVQAAIDGRVFRHDRVRERIAEQMARGTLIVDTGEPRVGQVNGLSVLTLGDYAFGKPSRITARVRLGKGDVIDIEREVELGGPLHSKGVFILSSFLGGRYAADGPLPLRASIVFEQSYGGVDGDSASAAELCALLSAIAEVPLRQDLAITGSVDQHGRIQAIGGVNEKIEGFFDLCERRGLTGEQGVIIPASNVDHLMLEDAVVEAVAAGRFRVIPIRSIDEAVELLTGIAPGRPDAAGDYPSESFNGRVAARIASLTERLAELAGDGRGDRP